MRRGIGILPTDPKYPEMVITPDSSIWSGEEENAAQEL